MKKLVLDPKKISFKKGDKNILLSKFFFILNKYKKKKFKYVIVNKKDINQKIQIEQIKSAKKISKIILREIIPKLNNIHNIKWDLKTWSFFLGQWIHDYVAIILDRLYLIKPLLKKKIDFSDQIFLGKKALIISNDLNSFTKKAATLCWNNKLLSRLIYLALKKDFNNNLILSNLDKNLKIKKENFIDIIFFNFKIILFKILHFFEKRKKFIFYNSYINNRIKLLKIILNLGSSLIPYSFSSFNNRIVSRKIDLGLRKKIELNYKNEKNIDLKIIKFLFLETFPLIYLEGFSCQKKIADYSHLPKDIKGIFTCSAHADNAFKFWLADKINKKIKIFFGAHGVNYNIVEHFYHQEHELRVSNKYFVWGKKKSNSKMISVGNFLVNSNKSYFISNKNFKILLVLPFLYFFKRKIIIFFPNSFIEDMNQINHFLIKADSNIKKKIYIRPHPKNIDNKISISNFIDIDKNNINLLNSKNDFKKIVNDYSILVFSYLSTEFLNSLSIDKPCLIYLNKYELKKFKKGVIKYFLKLESVGILHFSGLSLADKLNEVSTNVLNWWNDKKTIKAKKDFCDNYCDPRFNYKLLQNIIKKTC